MIIKRGRVLLHYFKVTMSTRSSKRSTNASSHEQSTPSKAPKVAAQESSVAAREKKGFSSHAMMHRDYDEHYTL